MEADTRFQECLELTGNGAFCARQKKIGDLELELVWLSCDQQAKGTVPQAFGRGMR